VACSNHRVDELPALMMAFHQLSPGVRNKQLQGMLDRVLPADLLGVPA